MRDYEADLWNTGLFKVANGEDITKAEKPGMFDLKVYISCFLLSPSHFPSITLSISHKQRTRATTDSCMITRARQRTRHGKQRSMRVLLQMRPRANMLRLLRV